MSPLLEPLAQDPGLLNPPHPVIPPRPGITRLPLEEGRSPGERAFFSCAKKFFAPKKKDLARAKNFFSHEKKDFSQEKKNFARAKNFLPHEKKFHSREKKDSARAENFSARAKKAHSCERKDFSPGGSGFSPGKKTLTPAGRGE